MFPPLLPLLAGLLAPPALPPSMPAEAGACLEAIAAPAPPSSTDRALPGPCRSEGPEGKITYTYQVGQTPQGGLPGPDATAVTLDERGQVLLELHFASGVAQAATARTWSGSFLKSERREAAQEAACSDGYEITFAMDDFGRPAGHTREDRPCNQPSRTTTLSLAWQADGTALLTGTDGEGRRAKGTHGADYYTVDCYGARCRCERRTYDKHNNRLRVTERALDGTVQTTRFDYGCWPPAEPPNPPQPGVATRGKELYLQYCQTCHGLSGVGDGPGGVGLPVRNLVQLGTEMCGQDNAILDAIRRGVGQMPGFPQLDAQQRRDILAYVRLLQKMGQAQ
ncbi:MAG: cytochrome c [Myxococcales bacterium]|nr:cytochrome c [Myxococcales bacterium]